jgi:hypothetical protein
LPAAQLAQAEEAEAPAVVEKVPAAQAVHEVEPVDDAY